MKIPRLDQWAMELEDYNISFVHIKGSNNILADAISRLKMLAIYRDPIEDQIMLKASNSQHCITEVNTNKPHILNSNVPYADQKWDITCKKISFAIP